MIIFTTVNDFVTWLNNELDKRNWSRADLARHANITQSSISMVVSGKRNPGIDFCEAVARALGVPIEVVLSAIGRGDQKPETEKRSLLDHMFELLPEDAQDDVLDFVRFKQEQWRREQAGQSGKPKPVTGELK